MESTLPNGCWGLAEKLQLYLSLTPVISSRNSPDQDPRDCGLKGDIEPLSHFFILTNA